MKELETIHSFGFSFSDVDMIYVEEIAEQCDDTKKVIWYLNTFDGGNTMFRQKLAKLGFQVEVDHRW